MTEWQEILLGLRSESSSLTPHFRHHKHVTRWSGAAAFVFEGYCKRLGAGNIFHSLYGQGLGGKYTGIYRFFVHNGPQLVLLTPGRGRQVAYSYVHLLPMPVPEHHHTALVLLAGTTGKVNHLVGWVLVKAEGTGQLRITGLVNLHLPDHTGVLCVDLCEAVVGLAELGKQVKIQQDAHCQQDERSGYSVRLPEGGRGDSPRSSISVTNRIGRRRGDGTGKRNRMRGGILPGEGFPDFVFEGVGWCLGKLSGIGFQGRPDFFDLSLHFRIEPGQPFYFFRFVRRSQAEYVLFQNA